jgi:hypothetical protein
MALPRRPMIRFLPLLVPLLPALQLLLALPALASSLGAWRITPRGVLELRTSLDASPQAFFEAGGALRGPRVWIDLPGPPSRSRTMAGSGALREVRIGRPDGQTTRLVLEFMPGTRLSPDRATSRRWWRAGRWRGPPRPFSSPPPAPPFLPMACRWCRAAASAW